MASYRDKINKKKLKDESGKIAWCIEKLANDRELKKEFIHEGLQLFDETYVERYRDDTFDPEEIKEELNCSYSLWDRTYCYEVCKVNQYGECYSKIVPIGCSWEVNKNVLDAQPWRYI